MINNKRSLVVLVVCLAVFGALLFPAIHAARTAAQKVQSSNNLKQMGLAIQNCESTFKRLPAGSDREARHGWMMFIYNYIESSPLYSDTEFNVNWEQSLNRYRFMFHLPTYMNPRHSFHFTDDGVGITDYHANPALLHRGSKITYVDIKSGLSQTWLAGEIAGNQTPFAYPYNWRELTSISSGPDSMGGWTDGGNFVFADGSVQFLSNKIDSAVLTGYANAHPLPEKERYEKPQRRFDLKQAPRLKERDYFDGKPVYTKAGRYYSTGWLDEDDQAECIEITRGWIKADELTANHPECLVLGAPYPKDRQELDWIMRLTNLEGLTLDSNSNQRQEQSTNFMSLEELFTSLQNLKRLKYLKMILSEEEQAMAKSLLPNCELMGTSVHRLWAAQ
jgi:prepilin-type processing-associated H-X9-DG protein